MGAGGDETRLVNKMWISKGVNYVDKIDRVCMVEGWSRIWVHPILRTLELGLFLFF